MRHLLRVVLLACALAAVASATQTPTGPPFRLAVAGLVHGHVSGFLKAAQARSDVQIVGIFEPDAALQAVYVKRFNLPTAVFYTSLGDMLDRAKPQALASFTSTFDHPTIVEAAAAHHVPVMMEKPLAVSVEHARRIDRAAKAGGIEVFVNYETTWYPSHAAMWRIFKEQRTGGEIRKMVALDGHRGPKEIGVQPEFLAWLTDPVKNGAGALFDFGCYGANLMTWMMDGQLPLTVSAMTQQMKPSVYPRVDDEATIVLTYQRAQGIIQASWNWPFDRKDFEVYSERAFAVGSRNGLRVRLENDEERPVKPDPRPEGEQDALSHLIEVARGVRKPNPLSSLQNNVTVTSILSAARESARTHKTIELARP